MEIHELWDNLVSTRLEQALFCTSKGSGFSIDHCHGAVEGVMGALMSIREYIDKNTAWEKVLDHLPITFRVETIPVQFYSYNATPLTMNMELITPFYKLWYALPDWEKENPKLKGQMIGYYLREIGMMQENWNRCQEGYRRAILSSFRTASKPGGQNIADFTVFDLAKPVDPNSFNWHGRNTSQWSYAGSFLVQDGRVSTHH